MSLIPWREKSDGLTRGNESGRSLVALRDAMDDVFERFLRAPWSSPMGESLLAPWRGGFAADVSETAEEVTVKAELPGVNPDDVQVEVTGQTLTIRGEKRQDREEKDKDYQFVERHFGTFQRSVVLPASVNTEKVNATFKNGVLTVSLPKHPDARPKRIPVKSR